MGVRQPADDHFWGERNAVIDVFLEALNRIPVQFFSLNNGLIVYQAIDGKNTIGTAKPGKSSGNGTSNGKDIEIGIITKAKEAIENSKLNNNSAFCFNQRTKSQLRKEASRHTIIFKLIICTTPNTLEKSASVAKK